MNGSFAFVCGVVGIKHQKTAPDAVPYRRCQARLTAKLQKQDEVWEMRFCSEHNHKLVGDFFTKRDRLQRVTRIRESIFTHSPGIEQQFISFNAMERDTSGENGSFGLSICGKEDAYASRIPSRHVKCTAVRICPDFAENLGDENLCLAASRDWPGFENLGNLDLDEEESLQ